MKTKLLVLLLMIFCSISVFAADKTTEVFTLDHKMSSHCEKKIMGNLRFEKGVKDLKVNLKDNTITITFSPDKTNSENIIKAFQKIGFNAQKVNSSAEEETLSPSTSNSCCHSN